IGQTPWLVAHPKQPDKPRRHPAHIRTPRAWLPWAEAASSDASGCELGCWFFHRQRVRNHRLAGPGLPRIPDRDRALARPWLQTLDRAERSSFDAARDGWHLDRATAKSCDH